MVDPRMAHHVDNRAYMHLMPHVDQSDVYEIRQQFARYLSSRHSQTTHATWQDGWNEWTGAQEHRPGQILYTPIRCRQCHGKRFDVRHPGRNLSRTGSPSICGECRGTGRGTPTRQTALYAHLPIENTTSTDVGDTT